ncbi:hypothetical protein F5148DRAFT_1191391 [Russula earlei]|uniref:Uncharacterized protein n=1 Tax=Russula earlei TaxID=71964 RepID=A0ACC0UBM8_9AGAM|nr:hypothetical protein F5148DRAFT_1191391 [Russula earlei]
MLSISSRDTKELRRGLNAAFDRLDQSRARASHAETLALDMLLRVREAEEERANAMRQASTVREELGKYKALLDNAHGEIRRAQQMLQDQEQLRYDAEASAARARDNARQMKQKRLIELAREQGRKMGFNEGIQAGQRIGYQEGQSSMHEGLFSPNEGPRFRELFDESKYRLDDMDQSPILQNYHSNLSSPHNAELPLPTPLPSHQVYPRLQGPLGDPPASAIDVTNRPPEAPHNPTSPPGLQRAFSIDSSSTTTLPAVPSQHVSFRAPPSMPTIPEAPSTEVGSGSWRSRSPRDSPRTQNHTPPVLTSQVSTHASVGPSVAPGAAFEPPPGIIESSTSGPVTGYPPDSGSPIYKSPSPHRAFNDPSVLTSGIIPDVSRSPIQEYFPDTGGAIRSPARERFENPSESGDIPSSVQERFTTIHSPTSRATSTQTDNVRFVHDSPYPQFSVRPSSRQDVKGVPPPRRDPPPKRRPILQMPAPLAPQSGTSVPYASRSQSMVQHSRPSEYDNPVLRSASLNAATNASSNWYLPSSQIVPNTVELRTDMMPQQRSRSVSMQNSNVPPDSYEARHPRRTTASPSLARDSPASQPARSQNLSPSAHVQIPPARYHTPHPASPGLASPSTALGHIPPADMYSPRAASPIPNINASDPVNQSPRRFPPTIYHEPDLQRRPTITIDHEQEGRASSPALPVPSRNFRSTSPRIVLPPADHLSASPYTSGQRTLIVSPHTPDDTLPVRPPSVSPRPSPAAFVQHVPPPQGGVTSPTLLRSASPNPLPRGASPAPLLRASSPAPLPIRSPSVRSARMHRSPSDVSLPGAHGSQYMHYDPNMEADIAVLASTSADKLPAPAR